jgi:hypothetical protein
MEKSRINPNAGQKVELSGYDSGGISPLEILAAGKKSFPAANLP